VVNDVVGKNTCLGLAELAVDPEMVENHIRSQWVLPCFGLI
jgi:hypothetical protein